MSYKMPTKVLILRVLTSSCILLFALIVLFLYNMYFSEDFIPFCVLVIAPVLFIAYNLGLRYFGFYNWRVHTVSQEISQSIVPLYLDIASFTVLINFLFGLSFIAFCTFSHKEFVASQSVPLSTAFKLDLVQQEKLQYSNTDTFAQVSIAGQTTNFVFELKENSKSAYNNLVEAGFLPDSLDRADLSVSDESTDIFANRSLDEISGLSRYVYVYELEEEFPIKTIFCTNSLACVDLGLYYRAEGYIFEEQNIVTVLVDVPSDIEITDEEQLQIKSAMTGQILKNSILDLSDTPVNRFSRMAFYVSVCVIFVLSGAIFGILVFGKINKDLSECSC